MRRVSMKEVAVTVWDDVGVGIPLRWMTILLLSPTR